MTRVSPSDRVLEKLISIMAAKGFTYHKKSQGFCRTSGPATQLFLVDFDGRGGLVSVGGGFTVRFQKLARVYEKAVGSPMGAAAFAGFSHLGVDPYKYDLFVNAYAATTPTEKGRLDPALVHPLERIDAGVEYVLESFENHVAPLFERLGSYRGLAGFLLEDTPGVTWTPGAPHTARAIPMALLLASALGDDPARILAYAEQAAPIYTGFDIRDVVSRTQRFIAEASPDELSLD